MNIQKDLLATEEYVILKRREFHANPELSFQEKETKGVICRELKAIGIPYVELESNCVVGTIAGSLAGKKIAIRADMDALPIQEKTDVAYASKHDGVMHACGHDGHVAMLLGAAKVLSNYKEHLAGEVKLCFQSAEEMGGGAKEILEYLESLGGVDEAIAIHLWSGIESGKISIVEGARMAAGDAFWIEVQGKGGHGSRPDNCIDPIKPAAQILLALSAIPANRHSTLDPVVIHIGELSAGTLGNIFPQSATMSGGIRTFSREARERIPKIMKQVVEHGANMYGAKAVFTHRKGVPAVYNHPEQVKKAWAVVDTIDGLDLDPFEPICASENFGLYGEKYKGFMAFLGIRNAEKACDYEHHHPKFNMDESTLIRGVEFFTRYVLDFLEK